MWTAFVQRECEYMRPNPYVVVSLGDSATIRVGVLRAHKYLYMCVVPISESGTHTKTHFFLS